MKKTKPNSYQWCPAKNARGNGYKLKYGNFHANMRKTYFTVRLVNTGAGYPDRFSSSLKVFSTWTAMVLSKLFGLSLLRAAQLDRVMTREPCQTERFCDSLIHMPAYKIPMIYIQILFSQNIPPLRINCLYTVQSSNFCPSQAEVYPYIVEMLRHRNGAH